MQYPLNNGVVSVTYRLPLVERSSCCERWNPIGLNSFILFRNLKSALRTRTGTVEFVIQHTFSHSFPRRAGASLRALLWLFRHSASSLISQEESLATSP